MARPFRWDSVARRYVDDAGRRVSPLRVREVLDAAIEGGAERMGQLSGQLARGELTIGQWQRGMAEQIKLMHVSSASAARGGWGQMSQADYGRVGARIKKQYQYLRRFAKQLESGEQKLDGSFANRCIMYAQSSRTTFEETRRRGEAEGGMDEERRVLHSMEGCEECLLLADQMWQPIGTLPPIGEQTCMSNCLCTFDYRMAPTGA